MNLSQEIRLELLGIATQLQCVYDVLVENSENISRFIETLDGIETKLKELMASDG